MPQPVKITKRRSATVKASDIRTPGVAPTFNLLGSRQAQDGATWDDHYKRAQVRLDPEAATWATHYALAQAKLAQAAEGPAVEQVARAVMVDPKLQKQLAGSGLTVDQYVAQLVADPQRLARLVAERGGPGWREIVKGLMAANPGVIDPNAVMAGLGENAAWAAALPVGQELARAGLPGLSRAAEWAPLAANLFGNKQVDRPDLTRYAPAYAAGQKLRQLQTQRSTAQGPYAAWLDEQIAPLAQQFSQLTAQSDRHQPDAGDTARDRALSALHGVSAFGANVAMPVSAQALVGGPTALEGDAAERAAATATVAGQMGGARKLFPLVQQAAKVPGALPASLLPASRTAQLGQAALATGRGAMRLPQILGAVASKAGMLGLLIPTTAVSFAQGLRRSYTEKGEAEVMGEAQRVDQKIQRGGWPEHAYQYLRGVGNLATFDPLPMQGVLARDALRGTGNTLDLDQHNREQAQLQQYADYVQSAREGLGQLLPGLSPEQQDDLVHAAAARRVGVEDRWDQPNTYDDMRALPAVLKALQEQGVLSAPLNDAQYKRLAQTVRVAGAEPALRALFYDAQGAPSAEKQTAALTALANTDAPLDPHSFYYTHNPKWQAWNPSTWTPSPAKPSESELAFRRAETEKAAARPAELAQGRAVAEQQTRREQTIAQGSEAVRARSKATWDRLRAEYGPTFGEPTVDRPNLAWGPVPYGRQEVAEPVQFTPQIEAKPDSQWAPQPYAVAEDARQTKLWNERLGLKHDWAPPHLNQEAWLRGGGQAVAKAIAPPAVPAVPTTPKPTPAVQPPALAQNSTP